jgi:hypothetical protein
MMMIAITVALAGCAEWALEPRPDDAPAPAEVLSAARAGDAEAAFLAYQQATTEAEGQKWICIAANRNLPKAQAEIARLHWPSAWARPSIFGTDGYKAYVWSIIARRNNQPLEHFEKRLSLVIPEDERWRATVQAGAWRPDPSQCENIEDSDYFSIVPAAEYDGPL